MDHRSAPGNRPRAPHSSHIRFHKMSTTLVHHTLYAGRQPTVVLIHGMTCDAGDWDSQIDHFTGLGRQRHPYADPRIASTSISTRQPGTASGEQTVVLAGRAAPQRALITPDTATTSAGSGT